VVREWFILWLANFCTHKRLCSEQVAFWLTSLKTGRYKNHNNVVAAYLMAKEFAGKTVSSKPEGFNRLLRVV
jgi:hypothetical protein